MVRYVCGGGSSLRMSTRTALTHRLRCTSTYSLYPNRLQTVHITYNDFILRSIVLYSTPAKQCNLYRSVFKSKLLKMLIVFIVPKCAECFINKPQQKRKSCFLLIAKYTEVTYLSVHLNLVYSFVSLPFFPFSFSFKPKLNPYTVRIS